MDKKKKKQASETNSELVDYFKTRYSRSEDKRETLDQMNMQKIKNQISLLCEKYLTESGQVFTFEVTKKDLQYVIVVIDEEPLVSLYEIAQISETLFQARLRDLDL